MADNNSEKSNKNESLRAVLTFVNGDRKGFTFKLSGSSIILGREKGDLIIKDEQISSSHCQIQPINGDYFIFDMNSSNGTWINGKKITKVLLQDRDEILIGKTNLSFTLEREADVRHVTNIFKIPQKSDRTSVVDGFLASKRSTNSKLCIILNVEYGDGERETLRIEQEIFYLGRASSFGKFEKDENLSRKHLMIKVNESGQIFIEDQNSTNGSWLNGKQISGIHMISNKDIIRIGSCEITVELYSQPKSPS